MGELWLQWLPGNSTDSAVLVKDYGRKIFHDTIAYNEYRLRNNPKDASAMSKLGAAEMGLGRVAEAFARFQQAVQADPNFEEAHYYLGIVYRTRNKIAEAQSEFETTVQLNPAHAKAHGNLGLLLLDKGDSKGAAVHFQLELKPNPTEPIAPNSLD